MSFRLNRVVNGYLLLVDWVLQIVQRLDTRVQDRFTRYEYKSYCLKSKPVEKVIGRIKKSPCPPFGKGGTHHFGSRMN